LNLSGKRVEMRISAARIIKMPLLMSTFFAPGSQVAIGT